MSRDTTGGGEVSRWGISDDRPSVVGRSLSDSFIEISTRNALWRHSETTYPLNSSLELPVNANKHSLWRISGARRANVRSGDENAPLFQALVGLAASTDGSNHRDGRLVPGDLTGVNTRHGCRREGRDWRESAFLAHVTNSTVGFFWFRVSE
ncbi:hypothetical protein CEXT_793461 [Caerostris extrusa]|uniref:Uncharacterized protein n=1 Tax=Caerostris extrusa TaxID=172846 RepID=A0AAV4SV22_CAEEX|nr:hypothetical protein CEXT_793461 [Caerostris extrusa]